MERRRRLQGLTVSCSVVGIIQRIRSTMWVREWVSEWVHSFLTVLHWMQGGLVRRKLSVCPSVKRMLQNGRKCCPLLRDNLAAATPLQCADFRSRKSNSRFSMSLMWTSYVVPKPPKWCSNRKMAVFRVKSHFALRKSATKFHCVKTVSGKVVRHLLAYLSVLKWLVGTSP